MCIQPFLTYLAGKEREIRSRDGARFSCLRILHVRGCKTDLSNPKASGGGGGQSALIQNIIPKLNIASVLLHPVVQSL